MQPQDHVARSATKDLRGLPEVPVAVQAGRKAEEGEHVKVGDKVKLKQNWVGSTCYHGKPCFSAGLQGSIAGYEDNRLFVQCEFGPGTCGKHTPPDYGPIWVMLGDLELEPREIHAEPTRPCVLCQANPLRNCACVPSLGSAPVEPAKDLQLERCERMMALGWDTRGGMSMFVRGRVLAVAQPGAEARLCIMCDLPARYTPTALRVYVEDWRTDEVNKIADAMEAFMDAIQ